MSLDPKSLTASIKIETSFAENLWPIEVDPGDLEDTILNLSLNSRDAMPDGGTLAIQIANKTIDESYVKLNPSSKVGDCVLISVTDTGEGMSEEVKEQVFEPFFTTKQQGKGTGLGLSMVYGFVQRSGGHISIYSEVGRGTTFNILIPRAKTTDAQKGLNSQSIEPCRSGNQTLLIVDDEDDLCDVAASGLSGLGYKTLTASNTSLALEILESGEKIDLMFSDVIMPGSLNGFQLAEAAHRNYPDLKILLASGFTKRQDYTKNENTYIANLANNLLSKPYNLTELGD